VTIPPWLRRALPDPARLRALLWDHRTLAILVAFLAAKQIAGSWLLLGRLVAPPNLLVALAGEGLLLLAPVFFLEGRWRVAAFLGVDLLVTAFVVADLAYFRQLSDLPSVASLKHAGQVARVDGIAATLFRPWDLAFLLGGLAALALLRPRRLAAAPALGPRRALAVAGVGLALAVAVALSSNTVRSPVGMRIRIANRLGSVGYHAHDAVTYFGRAWRSRRIDRDGAVAEAVALAEERAAPSRRPAGGRRLNVLVVQMEALQGFLLGHEVDGVPVTPNLNRLAAESLRFPRFFSQIAQGNTSDAELLAQCSLQPSRIGAAFYEYAGTRFRCLPELAAKAGWTTVVMHANDPEFWGRATTYPAIGFGTFFDTSAFSQHDNIGMGPSDAVFFAEAGEKLRRLPEPWYGVLLSLSSHMPFGKVARIPNVLEHGRFADTWVGYFLDAIRYSDEALGRLLDDLRRDGTLDRTILVVFGDHWGANRANSNLGDYLGISAGETARWFVTERRVPLLIRIPGAAGGDVVRTAGQVDLPPTLANLLGIPTGNALFLGRDLLDGGPGRIAFPSGSAADDERLYLSGDAAGGSEGCYRLGTLERLPLAACSDLKAEAERELRVGWSLLDGDLIARAGDERLRRSAASETASRPSTAPLPR
jgi:phosphoglycerol transferase MdoB-like AlkP superfamily enzyme